MKDDPKSALHIRCGSDIQNALKAAGLCTHFLEFSDPFCQGPVLPLDLTAFIQERVLFIQTAYGLEPEAAQNKIRAQYGGIDRINDYEHVVLWFEHDSYDQLILAYLLSRFSAVQNGPCFELICIDHYPGIERFLGLGQLEPETFSRLWSENRQPLSEAQMQAGCAVFEALSDNTPDRLRKLVQSGMRDLPFMANAIERHLDELPDPKTGLGRTQHHALEILKDHGPLTAGRMFRKLQSDYETLPFLGDLMFWHALDDLQNVSEPLLICSNEGTPWPKRQFSLTALGSKVLNGEANFLSLYQGCRYVGGIAVNSGYPG